jgi:hypothetical protein
MFKCLLEQLKLALPNPPLDMMKLCQLVPDCPVALLCLFNPPIPSLAEYLSIDEATIWHFLSCCCGGTNQSIAMLARGICERKLFKCLSIQPAGMGLKYSDKVAEAREAIKQTPGECARFLLEDSPKDIPFKLLDGPVAVKTPAGIKPLFEVSDPIRNLKEFSEYRLYFPAEARNKVEEIFSTA